MSNLPLGCLYAPTKLNAPGLPLPPNAPRARTKTPNRFNMKCGKASKRCQHKPKMMVNMTSKRCQHKPSSHDALCFCSQRDEISEVSEAGSETEAPGHLEERKASADQPVILNSLQIHSLESQAVESISHIPDSLKQIVMVQVAGKQHSADGNRGRPTRHGGLAIRKGWGEHRPADRQLE